MINSSTQATSAYLITTFYFIYTSKSIILKKNTNTKVFTPGPPPPGPILHKAMVSSRQQQVFLLVRCSDPTPPVMGGAE